VAVGNPLGFAGVGLSEGGAAALNRPEKPPCRMGFSGLILSSELVLSAYLLAFLEGGLLPYWLGRDRRFWRLKPRFTGLIRMVFGVGWTATLALSIGVAAEAKRIHRATWIAIGVWTTGAGLYEIKAAAHADQTVGFYGF
jgi:hypothetical protein